MIPEEVAMVLVRNDQEMAYRQRISTFRELGWSRPNVRKTLKIPLAWREKPVSNR